ncbi:MAG TPA: FMN-binding protein [Pseudomonadales bacterium]
MKMRMILGRVLVWAIATLAAVTGARAEDQVYRSDEAFLAGAFGSEPPAVRVLWVQPALRDELNRDFGWRAGLRIRYWAEGERSAWILDEIGKDKPITAGVVVDQGAIVHLEVLVFRESRGWEVRYPFFTDQFSRASLSERGDLTRHIDGITGATLSVRAVTRMARVALRLHDETRQTTLASRP